MSNHQPTFIDAIPTTTEDPTWTQPIEEPQQQLDQGEGSLPDTGLASFAWQVAPILAMTTLQAFGPWLINRFMREGVDKDDYWSPWGLALYAEYKLDRRYDFQLTSLYKEAWQVIIYGHLAVFGGAIGLTTLSLIAGSWSVASVALMWWLDVYKFGAIGIAVLVTLLEGQTIIIWMNAIKNDDRLNTSWDSGDIRTFQHFAFRIVKRAGYDLGAYFLYLHLFLSLGSYLEPSKDVLLRELYLLTKSGQEENDQVVFDPDQCIVDEHGTILCYKV